MINLGLACLMVLFLWNFPVPRSGHGAGTLDLEAKPREQETAMPDLSTLNVRLSVKPVLPPAGQIKRTVVLPGERGAKPLFGKPAQAAILEDDARRRVLILSADARDPAGGEIRAHLLYDFEIERFLPRMSGCTRQRLCAQDRTPGTGGLACVAICLVEALRESPA